MSEITQIYYQCPSCGNQSLDKLHDSLPTEAGGKCPNGYAGEMVVRSRKIPNTFKKKKTKAQK